VFWGVAGVSLISGCEVIDVWGADATRSGVTATGVFQTDLPHQLTQVNVTGNRHAMR